MTPDILNELNAIIDDIRSSVRKSEPPPVQFKLSNMGFFFQFVRPVWKMGTLSIALAILLSGLQSLLSLSGKVFIDFIILKTGFDGIANFMTACGLGSFSPTVINLLGSLAFVIPALLAAGILYGLLQVVQSYLTARYQQELTFNLRKELFDRVLRFPLSFFKDKQTGYLMSRVSDDVYILQYFFSSFIIKTASNLSIMLFGIGTLLLLDVKLVLLIVLALPLYLLMNYFFSGRMRALSYRQRESYAELSKDMQEVLSGVEMVKSYATEEKEVKKVTGRIRNVNRAELNTMILSSLSSALTTGIQYILVLMIMLVGAGEIQGGAMTIGDYVAFITYVTLLLGSVNSLFSTYLSFQPMFASMDRLKEMFSILPEYDRQGNKPLLKPEKVIGTVTFDGVSFAYAERPVLKNISFAVPAGSTIALVGPSGAGKTTLINLLLKLYVPQTGRICLDGNDLNGIDHIWLRKQISIVSQDIFLFNDTIENNIKYGKLDASPEGVIEAARRAHIHEDIVQLPNGYKTIVGERGVKLSVGQRQRISIARAFLKGTPLLILDEPSSALDMETEKYLKGTLEALTRGKTTFIISHRMSLTDIADRILVIHDGRIAQTGTNEELLQVEGLYKRLSIASQPN